MDTGALTHSQALFSIGPRTFWVSKCGNLVFDVFPLDIKVNDT
jgi:hypothetical protein